MNAKVASPLVVDFLVHVAEMPDVHPLGVVDPYRERQDVPWLDLLMARRVGDPWLVRIGDRSTRAPHIRVPTPEEETRESRGGLAAPRTRVGFVYANKLRAHMQVVGLVRHVEGLFLVLGAWNRFMPVMTREDIQWFAGWREREFRADELFVSENWAVAGLDLDLARRVKALLSMPPYVAPKLVGRPAEEQNGEDHAQQKSAERVVVADSNGGGTQHAQPAAQLAQAPVKPAAKAVTKKPVSPTNGGQTSMW